MAKKDPIGALAETVESLVAELRSRHHEVTKHDLEQFERKIMAAIDDLTAAVGTLNTTTGALTTAVDAAVTDIQNLGPTDAQLATLTQNVNQVTANIQAQADRLNAAVNPPPPPPPTP